jgi:hypothetical protein
MVSLDYPLTRPFPSRLLAPVAFTGAAFSILVLTLLNSELTLSFLCKVLILYSGIDSIPDHHDRICQFQRKPDVLVLSLSASGPKEGWWKL